MEDEARYLREIETRFVALRGRGFALSAKDVGRVLAWRSEGVPLRVVLQVLEEAMRRWRADGSRRAPTLGVLERSIDAAMKRRAGRVITAATAKAPEAGEWARMKAAIEAAGAASSDEGARSILRRAWATLKREEERGADAWAVAARLDAEVAEALMGELSEPEKRTMHDEAEKATASAGGRMSDAAKDERLRFEEARWTRRRYGLAELVGVLLG